MMFRQFCRPWPASSRAWSWHSVPVSKRIRASFRSRDFRKIWAQPSSLKRQRRSEKMVSYRDYEIYFLFLLLVKFHGSGNCEIYSPMLRIFQCFSPCAILSLETENADPLFLNVMFFKMKTVFVFQNKDMMLGFQSRDKGSLNNYRYNIDSMLLCICSVIDHMWCQNMVRTKNWHIRCS